MADWQPISAVFKLAPPRPAPPPAPKPMPVAARPAPAPSRPIGPAGQAAAALAAGPATPLFLHIPVGRLVVMSILSFGFYQAYWMYRNWRYVKERDKLSIRPFWRGIFGIFFCHSLLRRIHDDPEARAVQPAAFSPGSLATTWVALSILSNMISRIPGIPATLVSAFVPSFACLVPVQSYVNAVTERRSPGALYYRWSGGHRLCLLVGPALWALFLLALAGR